MKKLFISIFFLSLIIFASACKENTSSNANTVLIPLKTGNQWSYTLVEIMGGKTTTSIVTDEVLTAISPSAVSSQSADFYQVKETNTESNNIAYFYYSNLADGYYSKSSQGMISTTAMVYKYPCNVGDKFFNFTDSVEVASINEVKTIGGKSYTCIKYLINKKIVSANAISKNMFYYYVSPGIGLVLVEEYMQAQNDSAPILFCSQTLNSYTLK